MSNAMKKYAETFYDEEYLREFPCQLCDESSKCSSFNRKRYDYVKCLRCGRTTNNNAEEYKIYQAFCAKYNFTEDVQPLAQHR